jgi:Cu-Zn family superoxide dismutase
MLKKIVVTGCLLFSSLAFADIDVPLYFTSPPNQGKLAGSVHISQTKYGLLFTPDLSHLTPGAHGFHVHLNPSCEQNGMAAGGHLDPRNTNKHLGPYNDNGHVGDLPVLYVTADGNATIPVIAPRLTTLDEIKNHALMLHEGGDNYADIPVKLGGGGARMVCGLIQ